MRHEWTYTVLDKRTPQHQVLDKKMDEIYAKLATIGTEGTLPDELKDQLRDLKDQYDKLDYWTGKVGSAKSVKAGGGQHGAIRGGVLYAASESEARSEIKRLHGDSSECLTLQPRPEYREP